MRPNHQVIGRPDRLTTNQFCGRLVVTSSQHFPGALFFLLKGRACRCITILYNCAVVLNVKQLQSAWNDNSIICPICIAEIGEVLYVYDLPCGFL
jgi:hypothetical protein